MISPFPPRSFQGWRHFGVWKICGQEAGGAGVRAAPNGGAAALPARSPTRKPAIRQTQKVRRALVDPKAPPESLRRPRGPSRPGRPARRRAIGETPVSRRGGGDLFPIRDAFGDCAGLGGGGCRSPGVEAPDGAEWGGTATGGGSRGGSYCSRRKGSTPTVKSL